MRPSLSAPSWTRCSCSSRWPVPVNICSRVSASLTGRPTWRAAIAASVGCGQIIALAPKAPPMKCETTRILLGGMPSSAETVNWVAVTPWVAS
jgi:hypothetical protein